ncbi:MAG: molybdate ABC transporter substrate-binding protein [Deltaproteobacteria bacterium]|nr:molybdate ABC transporter substrate-binding protein [Deltaproteobacteria bacterium]
MLRILSLLTALLTISITTAFSGSAKPVVVFAGSASQPPLEEAAKAFEDKFGIPITLHLGGSGSMLSQILLSGQGDLYIPGSPDYMEKAREFDLIDGEEAIIAYLVPAILVPKGNPQQIRTLQDLTRPDLRVGMAEPGSVCVGLYAVEIVQASNLADKIRPNLRGQVESCAKAAAMLPLKTVDAVLGWREFATWNPQAMEAIMLNPKEIPRLAYIPAARLRHATNPKDGEAFIAYLKSEDGQAIFHKWGYFTEEKDARKWAPKARIGGSYDLPEGW